MLCILHQAGEGRIGGPPSAGGSRSLSAAVRSASQSSGRIVAMRLCPSSSGFGPRRRFVLPLVDGDCVSAAVLPSESANPTPESAGALRASWPANSGESSTIGTPGTASLGPARIFKGTPAGVASGGEVELAWSLMLLAPSG